MSTVAVWLIILCLTVVAMVYIFWNYARIKQMPEGTAEMSELAGIIRSGAETFLKTEFKYIGIVLCAVAVIFCMVIEKTSGISFLIGGLMSSIVCILGMKSATYANVRTSNKARESLSIGETVKVALCGGSISGLAVQAFGMFGIILVLLLGEFCFDGGVSHVAESRGFLVNLVCNPTMMRISTYSLGCSIVAMFNRVAGGNYTKAADISSDILGKLRHDLPEDDSRIPNTIADFIGDNVNDIAGNCSDLLESFVATMSATIMIAVTLYQVAVHKGLEIAEQAFTNASLFPIVLAACGLIGCLIGLGIANFKKMGDDPSRELDLSTWISAGVTVVLGGVASYILFNKYDMTAYGFKLGWASPWISSVLGIVSGVAIGIITEYYTATEHKPTRELAEICTEGIRCYEG